MTAKKYGPTRDGMAGMHGAVHPNSARGIRNRNAWVEALEADPSLTVQQVCDEVGVSVSTYRHWRQTYPAFGQRVDSVRAGVKVLANSTVGGDDDPRRLSFAQFRLRYFGHESPWFHLLAVEAYESIPPGNILMMLWPPEHGKTTLAEDYFCWKLALDPEFRILLGTEAQPLGRKILRRVKQRMDPSGPTPQYARDFGPFMPQPGGHEQPWGADYFNVFGKRSHDERDYSMEAVGITGAVAGNRTDHMHLDDIQSLKSLDQSEKRVDIVRQDWITRPGETGRTSINGTRVGEGDVYERFDEAFDDDILQVIKLPAIVDRDGEREPLWSERYSLEQMDRLRRKVGEEAWARNYMQNPRASRLGTFTEEMVMEAANPQVSCLHYEPERGSNVIIGLDPAIGSRNAIVAAHVDGRRMQVFDLRVDVGLANNAQIFNALEEMIVRCNVRGRVVTDVVIEAMAFQKGLMRDQILEDLKAKYGFRARAHLTGINKYDENIGVASMATSVQRQQLLFPYAADRATRSKFEEIKSELLAWKPKVRGNKLRQDLVMACWFAWILWRERRGRLAEGPDDRRPIRVQSLPWAPTSVGLLVPAGRDR